MFITKSEKTFIVEVFNLDFIYVHQFNILVTSGGPGVTYRSQKILSNDT